MTILSTNSLGLTLGSPLFTDLSLSVSKGDRLGLVAANGRGKSTLLKCLDGTIEPSSGSITRARGIRIGHVEQSIPDDAMGATIRDWVLRALPPEQADFEAWRVDVVLNDLNVPYDLYDRRLDTLSGGWRRTAMLAAVWIAEPDLLLLDEPTNHLDLHRISLLQDWMAALPNDTAVIVTSHDRAFLDAVTNRTLFLRVETSRSFPIPYSSARTALEEADAADERRFANDINKAQQLRKQAAKLKNVGVNSGSDLLLTKTKQLRERAEKMEAAAKPAYKERSAGDITLSNRGTHAKALVTFDDAAVVTPDGRPLYRTGRKVILQGDRVVLLGANGTGKTRLITMVQRALDGPVNGVKCAASLVPGISDQHLSRIPDDETPMGLVTRDFDLGDQRARSVLATAGIGIRIQDTNVGRLSGGQKARLAMLILRLTNPNFHLLDEPTNHLDIDGQEMLEEELIGKGATSLLVSHDRSFLRNVGNRFWWIRGKTLEEVDDPEAFLAQEMGGG